MKIDAHGKTLEKIFEEKVTYEVPDYQRPYSWTKDEIEDLFIDLEAAIVSNANHYFGGFVFNTQRKEKEKIVEIIDGQQRLTTAVIFLYVIRYVYSLDKFKSLPKVEFRRNKLIQYLEFLNSDGETIGMKLKLGEINKEFYEDFIVKGWNKTPGEKDKIIQDYKKKGKYESSKSISDAFNYIYERIIGRIDGLSEEDAINEIKNYQDTLLDKFEVIDIQVEQDADAFLIFETLNDRGLDLSSVDLIKNRLFKNCSSKFDFQDIKEKWINMISTLEDNSIIKKFLRHYWIANYEDVSYQNLFKSVRDKVGNNYDFSKRLVLDLNRMASYYDVINNPSSGKISDKRLIETLTDMNSLNFDLTHPILLAGFKMFGNDEDKLYKLSRLCLNFLVRFITIMKGKPSSIEKEIGECARNLRNDISIVSNLFQRHAKDSEFKEKMKNITVSYKTYSTYFMLVEYEKTFHKNEKWISPGRSSVTVEHILPVTVDFKNDSLGEWANYFTNEEHEIYLNRLGNLTLLGTKGQNKASNKKFEDKKDIYKLHTDMKMTIDLVTYPEWTKQSIEDRQEKIADKSIDIFTLDFDKI